MVTGRRARVAPMADNRPPHCAPSSASTTAPEGRPLVKPVIAVILAGGEGERLSILSSVRAKPAVPFGGKYRIIDFTLSNCVNSGIDNVVVLTHR